jgi:hypothetical protein
MLMDMKEASMNFLFDNLLGLLGIVSFVTTLVTALQASFARRLRVALETSITKDIEQALEQSTKQELDQVRSERDTALAHASPEIKYLIVQGERERDILRSELKAVREATQPRPVRQFVGNFLWNAGSLAAGVVIGHFFH